MIIWILAAGAIVSVALILTVVRRVVSSRTRQPGRTAIVVGLVLPALWLAGTFIYADGASREVGFCARCHEMLPYVESLEAADESLASAHYGAEAVNRDRACYTCHTRPGFGGYVEAKLTGLHDLRVHFLGEVPDELVLRHEYDTAICLKCHTASESFGSEAMHEPFMDGILSGDVSCLECHGPAHAQGGE